MSVEIVGEVFEDIRWKVPIFLLLFSLEVILSLLCKKYAYPLFKQFLLTKGSIFKAGAGLSLTPIGRQLRLRIVALYILIIPIKVKMGVRRAELGLCVVLQLVGVGIIVEGKDIGQIGIYFGPVHIFLYLIICFHQSLRPN